MGEAAINRFINSRVLTWLTAVVGIVAAYAMLLFFGTPSVPSVEACLAADSTTCCRRAYCRGR